MSPRSWILALVALAVLAGAGRAQEADALVPLDVAVTAVAGPLLTLDRGLDAGIEVGDRARVLGPLGQPYPAVVVEVRERSVQVELEEPGLVAVAGLSVGARGEVLVPAARARRRGQGEPVAAPTAAPEWTAPIEDWDPSQPLLAPAESPAPAEREGELYGRAWTRFEWSSDQDAGDRTWLRSWTGVDLTATNPFGQGGRVRFRGDLSLRRTTFDGEDDSESILRLDRLSYAIGGRSDEQHRFEVGRFLHSEFPEFGVIDGVEYVHRFGGGSRLGASVGLMPTWFDDREEDGDSQASLFYRFVTDPGETAALGIGYQKSWHDSEPDRDLFVGTADWRPGEATGVHASAWVDAYGADDDLKERGFQLTQAYLSIDRRFGASGGLSLFGSYIRWPELLRIEFPPPVPETIEDQHVARIGSSGWWRVSDGVTARARVSGWQDDEDAGGDGELGCDLDDALVDESRLGLSAFVSSGKWTSEIGGRLAWTQWIGSASVRLAYELADQTQDDVLGEELQLLQQRLGLVVDAPVARDVDLSVYGERLFGDQLDGWNAGLRLQWRF